MGKNSSLRETIKKQKNALIYLVVFLVVAIIGVLIIMFVGESDDKSDKHNRTDKIVKIGGVDCIPKQNIETYLLMGTDVQGKVDDNMKNHPGQADTIMLLVIDRQENTYALLPLNRDTITNVDSLDENGNYLATTKIQLALAHANGNGQEQSCENTAKAVSELLHDQYIDDYAALNMDAIRIINHKVGGVTVPVEDDFSKTYPSLKKGKAVKLSDYQASHYVHDRFDVGDETNANRMKRQDNYMSGLKKAVSKKTEKDKKFPIKLFRSLKDYMVTTIDGNTVSKISKAVLKNKYLGRFEIKGKSKIDDYGYNAFYYDQKSLDDVVRKLFYDEVKTDKKK